MRFKGWEKTKIEIEDCSDGLDSQKELKNQKTVEAILPIIISASRSTDIPAFYADWFIDRVRKGYLKWINPWNRKSQYISFSKTRVIVFWSKNPKNMIKYLPELDNKDFNYYFHFTLNDYEQENLEPNLPDISTRINTFIELSDKIGKDKVIWRFDPLLLSDSLTIEKLISKLKRIGDEIHSYTNRLVISFVDISLYRKVKRNLSKYGSYREFSQEEKLIFAKRLSELNQKWNLNVFTCAEEIDLTDYDIQKGMCVDYNLMAQIFGEDKELVLFLKPVGQMELINSDLNNLQQQLKDSGQREECGCIFSKDIGQYDTCMHLCAYCYANQSTSTVRKNYENYIRETSSTHYNDTILPK